MKSDYNSVEKHMKKIQFKITGNQEKKDGNPIPYFRTTQGTQFTKGAKRYHAWADYVRAAFIDAIQAMTAKERAEVKEYINFANKKPIVAVAGKIVMDLNIDFKDNTHGDCDNVFKGIADALFMNDKYLAGSFDYKEDSFSRGQVSVEIKFL